MTIRFLHYFLKEMTKYSFLFLGHTEIWMQGNIKLRNETQSNGRQSSNSEIHYIGEKRGTSRNSQLILVCLTLALAKS